MPTYTVKKDDDKSDHTWEIFCSYEELQQTCLEYNLKQVLSAPKIITGTGSLLSKTDDGWKENLKRIKKNAGRNSTIKV